MSRLTAISIDAVLPQTQCGLCGYGGCLPYAKAIAADSAPINLCPPGGVPVLQALAELSGQDAKPLIDEMLKTAKPVQLAVIDESLCIGCTKCIAVCPVDAIVGASKFMHSILTEACTGCGLCLPPCPMDCIDLIDIPPPNQDRRDAWRIRHQQHLQRTPVKESQKVQPEAPVSAAATSNEALSYIAAALARKKAKQSR